MNQKLIRLISIILSITFLWQNLLWANIEGAYSLRPVAFRDRPAQKGPFPSSAENNTVAPQEMFSVRSGSFFRKGLSYLRKTDSCSINFALDCSIRQLFLTQRHIKGKDVLVLGCGAGTACFRAVLEGANRVVGMDLDENSITVAKAIAPYIYDPLLKEGLMQDLPKINFEGFNELFKRGSDALKELRRQEPNRLNFVVGDARDLRALADDSFDFVVIPFLLAIPNGILQKKDIDKVLTEALRVLKPFYGHLLIYEFYSWEALEEITLRGISSIADLYIGITGVPALAALAISIRDLKESGAHGKILVEDRTIYPRVGLFRVSGSEPVKKNTNGRTRSVYKGGGSEKGATLHGRRAIEVNI